MWGGGGVGGPRGGQTVGTFSPSFLREYHRTPGPRSAAAAAAASALRLGRFRRSHLRVLHCTTLCIQTLGRHKVSQFCSFVFKLKFSTRSRRSCPPQFSSVPEQQWTSKTISSPVSKFVNNPEVSHSASIVSFFFSSFSSPSDSSQFIPERRRRTLWSETRWKAKQQTGRASVSPRYFPWK